ncbi:YDR156Wp-like protein, partial [Saccharomyces cerevisiae AWRI1631]
RTGNNTATTLNTPVVIHATQLPQHVSTDEVLQFLESFIDEKENIIDSTTMNTISGNAADADAAAVANTSLNIDTNLSSSISQLKRIQRDFKGLPPAQDFSAAPIQVSTTEKKETSIGVSAPAARKLHSPMSETGSSSLALLHKILHIHSHTPSVYYNICISVRILTSERLQCFFFSFFPDPNITGSGLKVPGFLFFHTFFFPNHVVKH